MLKFFRSIRRTLLDQGKARRYIVYAVGEIFLVMLGILLALQVNNWNEKRLDRLAEKTILLEIRTALTYDIEHQFDFHLSKCAELKNQLDVLYTHLTQDLPYHDSLSHYFRVISYGGAKNWRPQSTAFQNLQSIGVDLIRNSELKNAILRTYTQDYPHLADLFKNYQHNVETYGRPLARTIFSFGEGMFQKDLELYQTNLIPEDYSQLAKSTDFMNVLKTLKLLNIRDERRLSEWKASVESVIRLIDEELSS